MQGVAGLMATEKRKWWNNTVALKASLEVAEVSSARFSVAKASHMASLSSVKWGYVIIPQGQREQYNLSLLHVTENPNTRGRKGSCSSLL